MMTRLRIRNGFSLIEVLAVSAIISLIAFSMIGFAVYLVSMKSERLNTGCRKIRSWIAAIQSECVLNRRNLVIQYDLDNNTFDARFIRETPEDVLSQEEEFTALDLPEGVDIVSVSLDPYRTYYSQKVAISVRKDGWVTPHLVHLGIEEDDVEKRIYTLEVMALTGEVNVYTEEIGWEDLE